MGRAKGAGPRIKRRGWDATGFGPAGTIEYTLRLINHGLSARIHFDEGSRNWWWSLSRNLRRLDEGAPALATALEAAITCEEAAREIVRVGLSEVPEIDVTTNEIPVGWLPTAISACCAEALHYSRQFMVAGLCARVFRDAGGLWGWTMGWDFHPSRQAWGSEPFHLTPAGAMAECHAKVRKLLDNAMMALG